MVSPPWLWAGSPDGSAHLRGHGLPTSLHRSSLHCQLWPRPLLLLVRNHSIIQPHTYLTASHLTTSHTSQPHTPHNLTHLTTSYTHLTASHTPHNTPHSLTHTPHSLTLPYRRCSAEPHEPCSCEQWQMWLNHVEEMKPKIGE